MALTLEEKKQKLFGNHVLPVTPLTKTGEIDEDSTRNLVDFVINNGVHGILALGSTGEVFALTEAERKRFIKIVVDHTKGRVPVGVGVNSSSSDASVLLAKHAESIGVDYIFTCPPYYHPHREEGIYRHVKYIADATKDLPIMVYDGGAGIEISLSLLKRMTDTLPNLTCAKLFLPYPPKIAAYAGATNGKVQAWAGHDQMNYLMLLYGAKGMTSAASCVLPKEQTDMYNFIQAGNLEEARKIFLNKLAPLNAVAFANVLQYVQCYKQALAWMGIIGDETCKIVMEPLSEIHKVELRATMEFVGLLP
ncbi:MAG TPA: dihydrodipicolinate synthase family protein [Desulfosporosinus sp.]|nr:dihydrodipicolinate synthase family protein [Desulfosporosinus sp.]